VKYFINKSQLITGTNIISKLNNVKFFLLEAVKLTRFHSGVALKDWQFSDYLARIHTLVSKMHLSTTHKRRSIRFRQRSGFKKWFRIEGAVSIYKREL
jgi:hypothetical protein